jgi:hypothetical protein
VIWVEPFSFGDLNTLIRNSFDLGCPSTRLETLDPVAGSKEFNESDYFQLEQEAKLFVRFTPVYDWTWDINKEKAKWVKKGQPGTDFHVRQIATTDTIKWNKLASLFTHFFQGDYPLSNVKKIEEVHNPLLHRRFEDFLSALYSRHASTSSLKSGGKRPRVSPNPKL